ncbi:uncharacterized protein BROUX77_002789 [Berkeleyomyces rouxiae]|uniref:uncharacterized protein n=1 Tax=Berkeleyomyces rouxiae TaxID=2035830 RepID=UPI003B76CEE8
MIAASHVMDGDKSTGRSLASFVAAQAGAAKELYAPIRHSLLRGFASQRRRVVVVWLVFVMLCISSLNSPVSNSAPSYSPDGTLLAGETDEDRALDSLFAATQSMLHPAMRLIKQAEASFQHKADHQSKTLEEAVAAYRHRYGIPPPPNFDTWYRFATDADFQLIDEFDTIHHNLRPFWGLKPATLRARTREALGHGNDLLAISIRNGEVSYSRGSREWQVNATVAMISKFIQYLPDMDLAFNVNDEPKIYLPHDDLTRLLNSADARMAKASQATSLEGTFSARPEDMGAGKSLLNQKTTRFNDISRQQSWGLSRMTCDPASPARSLEEDAQDDSSEACYTDMCFVSNMTAFTDVCRSPSLATSYGFFVCPNSLTVSHDLIPIFSQSKFSTSADILYPSPWYWADKVKYNESADRSWEEKEDDLYWRGSTTGGYSHRGAWRRQHRQKIVEGLTVVSSDVKILANNGTAEEPAWVEETAVPALLAGAANVSFSHVGQCEEGDCAAQKDFFKIEEYESSGSAWAHRFLLDMDGNAFSGRFYAFLQSHSLPLKYALAREWHAERVLPWLHYVPLSLRGREWWELLRWLRAEPEGRAWAHEAAEAGRDWAAKALRKTDMEVWFFRLLLEYGRVIDDNREDIGFEMPREAPAAPEPHVE